MRGKMSWLPPSEAHDLNLRRYRTKTSNNLSGHFRLTIDMTPNGWAERRPTPVFLIGLHLERRLPSRRRFREAAEPRGAEGGTRFTGCRTGAPSADRQRSLCTAANFSNGCISTPVREAAEARSAEGGTRTLAAVRGWISPTVLLRHFQKSLSMDVREPCLLSDIGNDRRIASARLLYTYSIRPADRDDIAKSRSDLA